MKARTLTKLLSSVLCAALTMQIGWGVTTEKVSADATYSYDNATRTGTFSRTGTEKEIFKIRKQSGELTVSATTNGTNTQLGTIYTNSNIVINPGCEVNPNLDVTFDNVTLCADENIDDWALLYISGITVTINETLKCQPGSNGENGENRIYLMNTGDLIIDTLDLSRSDMKDIWIYNDGAIEANNVIIDNDNGYYSAGSNGTIYVSDSFEKDDKDLTGAVYAWYSNTTIKSAGGTFEVVYGSISKTFTEAVDGTVAELLLEDPELNLANVPNLYYGQSYDFSTYMSTAEGYTGEAYLAYKKASADAYSREKPVDVGTYYIRAEAPESGAYRDTVTAGQLFEIRYLPVSELLKNGASCTLSGIVNGKYVPGDLVLTMPEGVLIKGYSFAADKEFANSITLTQDDIITDGHYNQNSLVQLRRASDNATTNGNTALNSVVPEIDNLVFDLYDPYVDVQFVDDVEASIEDGRVTGDKVELEVYDDNLDKIYINGELYEYDNSDGEGEVEITLNSIPGQTTEYTIKATDLAGKSTTLSFTLHPNSVDPTLSVSVPETVYVGDDYDVTVKTNSDGRVSYQYSYTDRDTYLEGKPTSAGKYVVTVAVSETEFYNAAVESATYTILKRTPSAEVYVPDSNIGESYSPVVTTDSDGKEDAVIEYKPIGTDDRFYSTTKPAVIGAYTVRVTIPETAKYNAAVATSEFTIKKKVPAFVLNIGSPYVGTDYKPSVTTNSDGAAKVVIEYKAKDASDDTYTTTVPTTYGTYVVRATVPETATFASVSATTDFTLRYLEAPANAFEMTGTTGKNGYYVSGVELKAPAGYLISGIYGGTYTESITYTDSLTSVYLKRTSDNALTSAIAINKPKIDTQAPSFKAGTGSIASGSVMYVSNINITVDDPNLKSLKVNGEPISLTSDKDNVLTLSPGFGTKTFKITAEDEAGNISNIEFTLKAEWLESKTIIPDVVLPLEGNEYYNLGEGYWIVTRNTPEGPVKDNTVYSGGMPFYVEEGGDYTFTKVT